MPKIVVLGGGVCGLAGAIMLARDGHDVCVLERDPAPVPETVEDAWEAWDRGGVAQFRQAHFLQARGRHVLDAELPDVRDALLAAGAAAIDTLDPLPAAIPDRWARPGDDRFATVTARRTTIEQVMGRAAEAEPRVEVRRGVAAASLIVTTRHGIAHVTGVRAGAGDRVDGDLIVDAMGRRSRLPGLLQDAAGTPVAEEAEDSGFVYYTRFFRGDGPLPELRTPRLSPLGTFSILVLPSDNGTWSVTVYSSSGDRALKRLRHVEPWTAVVRACPLHAHWLDGEPISGIIATGGVVDRYRCLVPEGRPAATGLAALGDASACTNPSLGRGLALGLAHAAALRDVVRAELEDPRRFAAAWHEATERELGSWYRASVVTDRARLAEIEALRAGRAAPAPTDMAGRLRAALPAAMGQDGDVFRAGLEIMGCLALPQDVFARPGLPERVLAYGGNGAARPLPAPSRAELLGLVA